MDIRAEKKKVRDSIEERIHRMSEKDRAAESRTLCRRILEHLPETPGTITAFVPLVNEPLIRPLLQELLDRGWKLFLPTFEGGVLAFRQATDLKNLIPGALQIPEPPKNAPPLDPATLDIVLTPARAYDRTGNRLGRGNGGYDIWIRKQRAANPSTKFWGVCYECQVLNDVPMEAHDEKVDVVITARGKFDLNQRK